MTLNMNLRRWTFKPISFMKTLSAFFTRTFVIRSWKIWSCSDKSSSSWFSPTSGWRWINYSFCFCSDLFTVNFLLDINRIMSKNIFISCLLFLLIASFFIRMRFYVIFNYTVENRISHGSSQILSTCNTLLFFCYYQISQTSSTKSMITRLHAHGNVHYFITKSACYLFFYFTGETVWFILFTFLLLFLLFCFLLFFRLFLLLLFQFLLILLSFQLLFLLFLLFYLLLLLLFNFSLKDKLNSKSQSLSWTYSRWRQHPNLSVVF